MKTNYSYFTKKQLKHMRGKSFSCLDGV